MPAAVEFVKKHPIAIAAGIFVVGAGYLLLSGGSSSNTATTASANPYNDPSVISAELSAQAQQAQLQAQVQGQANQIAGQINLAQLNNANAVTLANLQANDQNHLADLQAQIASLQSNNQTAVQQNQINTSGAVQLATLNTQTAIENIIQQASVQNTNTLANLQAALGAQSASVAKAAINAQSNQGFFGGALQLAKGFTSLSGPAFALF